MRRHPLALSVPAVLVLVLSLVTPVVAQPPEGEARERQVMERFLSVLERTPRRGTALDRVYGYHVERGTLDALVKTYQDRTARQPADGLAWLLLGLIESQRGRDAAAVAALEKAEQARPDDALASFYLGQALVLVGKPDAAAAAFERAITRKPSRADTLEIYQALGRVHQRARRNDQALAVWTRLEKLFPADARVQEQIAAALAEESQFEPALARYETLAKSARDAYRKVQFRIEAADLKVRLGRGTDALADFESLLAGLDPESWLSREVRRKIEDVFLHNDDQAGLATYYQARLKQNPDDVEAMARLGRTLATQGRAAEAREWFDRAVQRAPSRRELRLALIEQLVQDRNFAAAAAQYEAIAKTDPNNPDVVRDWGRLLLKDTSKPEPERRAAAAAVWRRLVDARPNDPGASAQAADLFRQAELADDALALYKKAVDLAPDAPQYREYLGEYYHALKRPADALAAWRGIAEGKNRTAKNLARLGEVFSGFGYKTEALEAVAAAVALEPDGFDLRLKYADLLGEAHAYDQATAQLDAAAKLADGEEGRESVLTRRITLDQAAGRLATRLETLRKEVAGPRAADAVAWRTLARHAETAQQATEAVAAIEKAVTLDAGSIASWTTAERLYDAAGRLADAADVARRLATLDRRARTEHLTSAAKLETRLGRRDRALQAGRDLLAAAPGNPENAQFFADLCFQLGENDEGLDTLRRAARAGGNDPKALTNLAEALGREYRTEEAIELFWRAFDRTSDIDGKLGIVARLAELYLQRDQFDRLTGRLERLGREEGRQREATLCLAQALASAGDYGTARQQLEGLLAASPRDTALLKQLSEMAENEGDLAAAAKFQKQLVDVAPNDEATSRLAQLYVRAGDLTEAEAAWARFTADGQESWRSLQAIDSLLAQSKFDSVLAATGRMLRKNPSDWEALIREARALGGLDREAEAAQRFQALLDLRRNDDEEAAQVKARKKGWSGSAAGTTTARAVGTVVASTRVVVQVPARDRLTAATPIRYWLGLMPGLSSPNYANWSPADFGQARMAALGWLFARAGREGKQEAWLAQYRPGKNQAPADVRHLTDALYVQYIRMELADIYQAARDLSRASPDDPTALYMYLTMLSMRTRASSGGYVRVTADTVDRTPPMPPADVDLMVASYRKLHRLKPDWTIPLPIVFAELKRAKREADADLIYRDLVASANDPVAIASACSLATERGDIEGLLALFDTFERVAGNRTGLNQVQGYILTSTGYYPAPSSAMAQMMLARADAKAHKDIFRLLDRYLAYVRSPAQVAGRARALRSGGTASSLSSARGMFIVYTKKSTNPNSSNNYAQVDYPAPGLYLDLGAIQLLRNAYELFRRDDLSSDLLAHVRKPLDAKAGGNDALYAHLMLSALRWWADEKDEAVRELRRASDLVPGDVGLRLDAAELLERRQEPEEALTLADSVEPVDQAATQRRELLALRLAVKTGQVERARQAAERLFGLRLDTDMQVQLAAQMHQLGMHELAEAVLARARRRAGNNADVLISLMDQYQRQGQVDQAVQVAHQILRRTPTTSTSPIGSFEDQSQVRAVQVLARSGKLKEMTERVEAQVRRSPQSLQLQQSLAAYYRATGDRAKLRGVYEAIAALRPADGRLRFQLATQLAQSGDTAAALDHYRAALRKEPSLLSYRFYEVQNAFQQAGKLADLVKLVDAIDIKSLNSPSFAMNLVQSLAQNPKTVDQALALLKKLWAAFPDQRAYLGRLIATDEVWKRPEMFDLAREALIPRPGQTALAPWSGFDVYSYMGDGRVSGLVTQLLDAAARQNRLEVLAADVQRALKDIPEWTGGKALLGLIRIRQGRTAEGKAALQPIVADKANAPPFEASLLIGQELEAIPDVLPVAVTLYEAAMKDDPSSRSGLGIEYGPARRLARLYQRAGRNAEARNIILGTARSSEDLYATYPPEYVAYQKLNELNNRGTVLLELGFPADAVKAFGEVLASGDLMETARPYIGDSEYMMSQANAGVERALHGLNRETLGATLQMLAKPGDGSFDLVLTVYPHEMDRAAITSLVGTAVDLAAASPALRAETRSALEALAKARPDDVPAQVAKALADCAGADAKTVAAAADRLEKLADRAPLETLSEGERPNSRQRAEAARRMGLWLVARLAWKDPSTRAAGDRLAALALEGAKRQLDNQWTLAMLREWGQVALDRGDRKTAEARWTALLDLIVHPPALRSPAPRPAAPSARPAPSRPANGTGDARPAGTIRLVALQDAPAPPPTQPRATTRPSPARRAGAPAITPERFNQAMQLARLAAENDMPALSLRAVREALAGGPPVAPVSMTATNTRSRVIMRSTIDTGEDPADAALNRQIQARLEELERLWMRHKVAAERIYEALRDAVLPEQRPGEVFLYPGPLQPGAGPPGTESPWGQLATAPPQALSTGARLAHWAAAAGKSDELRARLAARRGRPTAELPALVLEALICEAEAETKPAAVAPALAALDRRLQNDVLQSSADLAYRAALPALSSRDPAAAAAAPAVLARAIKTLSNSPNDEPAGTLLAAIARYHFRGGNIPEARRQLTEYLAVMDRVASRYGGGGTYADYRRRQVHAAAAAEYIRAGLWRDALETLGLNADTSLTRGAGGEPPLDDTLVALAHQAATRPAQEQYDVFRAWTFPTPTRRSVRILAATVDDAVPPPPFVASGTTARFRGGVVDTATLLIDAARQAGRLDALADELAPLAAQNVENARPLLALVEIARGRAAAAEPLARAMAAESARKVPAVEPQARVSPRYGNEEPPAPPAWPDVLVAHACLHDPALAGVGEPWARDLARHASRTSGASIENLLAHDSAAARARLASSPEAASRALAGPDLALWQPATLTSAYDRSALSVAKAGPWLAHEGYLVCNGGRRGDFLQLAVPLTGSFTFAVDAYIGDGARASLGYGGLVFDPCGLSSNPGMPAVNTGQVAAFGTRLVASTALTRVNPFVRKEAFNRLAVEVAAGKLRFLINGHRFYETDRFDAAAPWVALGPGLPTQDYDRGGAVEPRAVFRNPTLTGKATIPRAIALSGGDRLDGWISTYYNETQPPHNRLFEGQPEEQDAQAPLRKTQRIAAAAGEHDWSARGGEILGHRFSVASAGDPLPGRLFHLRPIRDGETLHYEFFYEPGQTVVHPTLGRLAFLLEPEGVRLHWMTDRFDIACYGVAPDNVADVPAERLGPKPLPLKPAAWNDLTLRLQAGHVTLTLNGQEIEKRPVDPDADRHFGFYHERNQVAARVRNVRLEGNWPTTIASDHLLDPAGPAPDAAVRRARHAVVGEDMLARAADVVLEATASLPPAQRYEALAAWVLPGADHPGFRLEGDLAADGQLRSPAQALVAAAREADRLADLAARVEKAGNPAGPGRHALNTLIRLARDDEPGALAELAALKAAPGTSPWPGLVAATAARGRPALVKRVAELLDALPLPPDAAGPLAAHVRHSRALAAPAPAPDAAVWTAATVAAAAVRGQGFPPAVWSSREGVLRHEAGHGLDLLMLNVPLRGDFEVRAELSPVPASAAKLAYGSAWAWPRISGERPAGPLPDAARLELGRVGRERVDTAIEPVEKNVGTRYLYRLVVKAGTLAAYVGARKVHEAKLPDEPDPWLAIVADAASTGAVGKLTIAGAPVIPEALHLSAASDLSGWYADEYGESLAGARPTWSKAGAEIRGRGYVPPDPSRQGEASGVIVRSDGSPVAEPVFAVPGSHQESTLRYDRPLAEDGELTYEFYYEPGKTNVAPALGRLAFLLEPEGVQVHRLTDGPDNRGHLDPGNAATEPESRRGPSVLPLRPRAWNTLSLTLQGNLVSLALNGVLVFERRLEPEPSSDRTFAFFHFADQTDVRVRSVTYRGHWPRSLPATLRVPPH